MSSIPNMVHILPAAPYVQIPVAAALTGYSEKAIRRKIERKEWHEGDQCHTQSDGTVVIDLDGYARWCEGKAAPAPEPQRKPAPPGRTSLYRHFDAAGRLLYVGISVDAVGRLAQHVRYAAWTSEIVRVEVERFTTRAEALEAERAAIKAEKPLHNIIHAEKA